MRARVLASLLSLLLSPMMLSPASGQTQDKGQSVDADGNDNGCHGVGCLVDNPDHPNAGQPANTGSSEEMKAWEESNRTTSSSSDSFFESSNDRKPNGKDWTVDSLVGSWTIGERDGTERCSIALDDDEIFGLRKAWTSPGCTGGLFGNNRWRAAGRYVDITDMGGNVVASFRNVGPGRFEGRRKSDGAPLYMSK